MRRDALVPPGTSAIAVNGRGYVVLIGERSRGEDLVLAVAHGIVDVWCARRGVAIDARQKTAVVDELLAPSVAVRLALRLGFRRSELPSLFPQAPESALATRTELDEDGPRSCRRRKSAQ
jgi:hypothetical protein